GSRDLPLGGAVELGAEALLRFGGGAGEIRESVVLARLHERFEDLVEEPAGVGGVEPLGGRRLVGGPEAEQPREEERAGAGRPRLESRRGDPPREVVLEERVRA